MDSLQAKRPSVPSENKAKRGGVWSLVCITRLGRVSMLKHLTLREARETYKRLLPDTRPKTYIFPKDARGGVTCNEWSRRYGPTDDWLERVEAIGPEGEDLDPWHGVEPIIKDLRSWNQRAAEEAA